MTNALATTCIHLPDPLENIDTVMPPTAMAIIPAPIELSRCRYCAVLLCRQVAPDTISLPIPRDWDAAHVEALADMAAGRGHITITKSAAAKIAAAMQRHNNNGVKPFFAGANASRGRGFGVGDEGAPLERRQPGRAQVIASLHSFADWLAAHPDIPVPNNVMASYWVTNRDELDQETRYQEVRAVAGRLGAHDYGSEYGDLSPQADYRVATRKEQGVNITYRAATFSDAYYAKNL